MQSPEDSRSLQGLCGLAFSIGQSYPEFSPVMLRDVLDCCTLAVVSGLLEDSVTDLVNATRDQDWTHEMAAGLMHMQVKLFRIIGGKDEDFFDMLRDRLQERGLELPEDWADGPLDPSQPKYIN